MIPSPFQSGKLRSYRWAAVASRTASRTLIPALRSTELYASGPAQSGHRCWGCTDPSVEKSAIVQSRCNVHVLVLVFILAAFSMLALAVVTATPEWAWLAVSVSVLAGTILVADWKGKMRAFSERNTIGVSTGGPEPASDPPATAFPLPASRPELVTETRPPSPRPSSRRPAQQTQLAAQNDQNSGATSPRLVPNPRVGSDAMTGRDRAQPLADSTQPPSPDGTRSEDAPQATPVPARGGVRASR